MSQVPAFDGATDVYVPVQRLVGNASPYGFYMYGCSKCPFYRFRQLTKEGKVMPLSLEHHVELHHPSETWQDLLVDKGFMDAPTSPVPPELGRPTRQHQNEAPAPNSRSETKHDRRTAYAEDGTKLYLVYDPTFECRICGTRLSHSGARYHTKNKHAGVAFKDVMQKKEKKERWRKCHSDAKEAKAVDVGHAEYVAGQTVYVANGTVFPPHRNALEDAAANMLGIRKDLVIWPLLDDDTIARGMHT